MIVFTFDVFDKEGHLEYVAIPWQVGDKIPDAIAFGTHRGKDCEIFEVEASGNEYQYILTHFHGLPIPILVDPRKSAHWFGEMARFIAYNLS
jgi:hypothetical protein